MTPSVDAAEEGGRPSPQPRPLALWLRRLWSLLHGSEDRIRATVFGTFDGATSSFGVTFAMFAQHRQPVAFLAPILGLAIASAAGMGGGEAASSGRSNMVNRALVMGACTFFGVIVVALPYFFVQGPVALVTSLALALALGAAIAERRRRELGSLLAYGLTFGVLAVAIGVTSAVAVLLPGSGA